ncbi:hypothetical protein YC2023_075284 [Brassica napus]
MQVMRVSALEDNQTGETFSQRAEWFYQRRPLLLSLCQDLFDGYATLLNCYNQAKPQNPKPVSHENDSNDDTDISSQVESILSFEQTQITACDKQKVDELVSQLVTANLERDMAQDELLRVDVEETVNLGYKLTSLLEENKDLATEANSDMELQELIIY